MKSTFKHNWKLLKELRTKKWLTLSEAVENFEYTRKHTISRALLHYYESGERRMNKEAYDQYIAYLEGME